MGNIILIVCGVIFIILAIVLTIINVVYGNTKVKKIKKQLIDEYDI